MSEASFKAHPGAGRVTVPFGIDGLPVVEDGGQAIYAEAADVELTLAGEVDRVVVKGRKVFGPAPFHRGPEEIHFLPEEFAGAGRVVQHLVAAARAEWEAGALSIKPKQAHEQPKLHAVILEVLEHERKEIGEGLTQRELARRVSSVLKALSPSETALRKALLLLEEAGQVSSRLDLRRNGKPKVWRAGN